MGLVVKSWGVHLGFSRGAVVIRQRCGGERRVPIYQVDRILTGGVAVSSRLLRECARVNRRGGFDGRGTPLALVSLPEANGTVSHWGRCEAHFDGRGGGV